MRSTSSPESAQFDAGGGVRVGSIFEDPAQPRAVLVFGHGAGAGMAHPTMDQISAAFVTADVAVMRFNFPFMEAGRRRVDAQRVSVATVGAAAQFAAARYPGLPLLLGGHSYGGRMASHAVLDESLAGVKGLVFGSFPLHPAKKPGIDRAAHLGEIGRPMLFLSGTRDGLAERELLSSVVEGLPRARLHWLDTADHGYKVLKRSRQTEISVFEEMSLALGRFLDEMNFVGSARS